MNNIKNLLKILLALGLLGSMMVVAAFAFIMVLGVAMIVEITLYVHNLLPRKNGATAYYETSKDDGGKVIEGEIITQQNTTP